VHEFELAFDVELSIIPSQEVSGQARSKTIQDGVSSPQHIYSNPNVALDRYMLMTPNAPFSFSILNLVEESDDLSGNVLASGLFVVHDASRGGQDDVSKLTRWQKLDNPLLKVAETDVVAGGDDTSLVETLEYISNIIFTMREMCLPAVQLDDNLARAVVVNLLEFSDVSW